FILCTCLMVGSHFVAASGADAPPRPSQSQAEWSQWRGPNRDGISSDTGLLKDWTAQPPKLLWTAEGVGGGYASVSIGADRIYTTGDQSDSQAVTCISAADGKVLWTKPITDSVPKFDHGGSRSTPSID